MGTQDNFSKSKEGCCKWETLVDTENSLCSQGNLCIDTTFFDWSKLCGVHKGFQGFLCKLVSYVLFQLKKLFLDKNMLYRYYTMNLKTSNF